MRVSALAVVLWFGIAFPIQAEAAARRHAGRPVHPQSRARVQPGARAEARGAHPARAAARPQTARHVSARQLRLERRMRSRHIERERTELHATVPTRRPRRVRLVVPPPLRGSYASLVRQNDRAEADGHAVVHGDDDLAGLVEDRDLVALPSLPGLRINPDMPANRRYARPWTVQFLTELARVHWARFHTPLQVNSAARTVEFQKRLMLVNGNAAPADGDVASPHLTGAAIDIGKHGLSLSEIGWLRAWLLPLEQAGKVDVEEEFRQACFHISVYRRYAEPAAPPHGRGAALLATEVR
jgi:hypothetical protein